MKDYTHDSPVFSRNILITEVTDPAHADNINAGPKQLLQNTLVLLGLIEDYTSEDTLDESFYGIFGGDGGGGSDTSMSRSEIMESINTEWNGESSSSETAMSAVEVQESIDTKWDGSSSPSDTAMNKEEIEEATT